MNTAEAAALSTSAFIDENPTDITLMRSQWEQTSAGGRRKTSASNVGPIRVRLVAVSTRADYRLDEDGEQVLPNYIIVALPDADIQRWDTFMLNGHPYKVLWIQDSPSWALRAEVIERG